MRRSYLALLLAAALAWGCSTSSGNTGKGDKTGDAGGTGGDAAEPKDAGDDAGRPGDPDMGTEPDTRRLAGDGKTGEKCESGADCKSGFCFANALVPDGYCTTKLESCDGPPCPSGEKCAAGGTKSYCVVSCSAPEGCAGLGVEQCNIDGQCWLGTPMPKDSGVGGGCSSNADCVDEGAQCYPETLSSGSWTGFVHGYCLLNDCTTGSCPDGAICQQIYQGGGTACMASCKSASDCRYDEGYACVTIDGTNQICWPGCGGQSTCPDGYACDQVAGECVPACTETSCPAGKVCTESGVCADPPCTADNCPGGMVCASSGVCVPDMEGGPGPGPGPDCTGKLPERDCTGTTAYCAELIQFDPKTGYGYDDYPLNGETSANQYRSWLRRDIVMLMKWAAAYVECKAKDWEGGNGAPIGLGDMSEKNGAIPGASVGSPGHPSGTHTNGYDIDVAYFQNQPPDNKLRAICDHVANGEDQYHCISEPWRLDVWRTALMVGAIFDSPRTRVIGCDGKAGPYIEQAMLVLCGDGWLPQKNCNVVKNYSLAYEVTDGGSGWYYFHHHHIHFSSWSVGGSKPGTGLLPGETPCLTPDCGPVTVGPRY